jgi:uncharacterized protein (TIGR02466 family)
MKEFALFPIMLGVDYIDTTDYLKTINEYITKNNPTKNDRSPQLRHYQRRDPRDAEILDHTRLKNLKHTIVSQANAYYHDILGFKEELYLSDSWLNVCEPGGFQPDHYHTNAVVSGTYYVVINDQHPKLEFRNPRLTNAPVSPEIRCDADHITAYNSGFMSVGNLINGSVLYWPSYLVHGYSQNNSDTNRISISFNLNIRSSNFLYHSPFTLV